MVTLGCNDTDVNYDETSCHHQRADHYSLRHEQKPVVGRRIHHLIPDLGGLHSADSPDQQCCQQSLRRGPASADAESCTSAAGWPVLQTARSDGTQHRGRNKYQDMTEVNVKMAKD